MRALLASGLALWAGAALLLSSVRWFARPSLEERLRPHAPAAAGADRRPSPLSVASWRDVLRPLALLVGDALGRLAGPEPLAARLARARSPMDPLAFRSSQLGRTALGLLGGSLAAVALRPPAPVALLLLLGTPALVFLLVERSLQEAVAARRRRLQGELPVVAEQLATLLASGWSVGGALQRVASRGGGAVAEDLATVVARVRQGLDEAAALREWRDDVDLRAVDRLVAVLALNRETTDLGRLLADEARRIREDHHRALVEQLGRRAQQVWIPVTVATLLPGAVVLAIPFVEALRLFTGP